MQQRSEVPPSEVPPSEVPPSEVPPGEVPPALAGELRVAPGPGLVGGALAAVALALGAAPSVTDRDAGELASAAFLLDVPHPTGFPLDMAALRLAELAPVGDVAFRANLAVGALTALACGLVTRVAWALCASVPRPWRWPAALLPAVALVASPTVLRAATAVEVYASSLAAAALALWLVLSDPAPGAEGPRRRGAALLAGATLALHTSARPAAALALAILITRSVPWARGGRAVAAVLGRRALASVALGLCGLAAVGYLPVAARRGGPIDWGDPETPAGVWRHLTAALIREAYAPRMMVPWRIPEDLRRAAGILVEDLGMPLLLAAAAGALVATRDRAARLLLAVTAVDLTYSVAVNPMGMSDRQTLFMTELGAVLLAGCAVGALARWRAGRAPVLAGVLAAALGLAAVARCDRGWAGAADGWSAGEILGGAGALGAVPARAVVLCASDDLCGGAFYAQWIEGERPDVTVLPRQHLADTATWRRLSAQRFGAPAPVPVGAGDLRQRRLRALVRAAGERLRWEAPEPDDARWLGLQPGSGETPVLATTAGPVTAVDLGASPWVSARMPGASGAGARWVGAMVVFGAARRAARVGMDRAVPLWTWVVATDPRHAPAYTNLGVAAARAGHLGEAVALTRRALAIDPERSMAWRNLAEFLSATGDPAGAAAARSEARRRTE